MRGCWGLVSEYNKLASKRANINKGIALRKIKIMAHTTAISKLQKALDNLNKDLDKWKDKDDKALADCRACMMNLNEHQHKLKRQEVDKRRKSIIKKLNL
jgi:hypothetical protein